MSAEPASAPLVVLVGPPGSGKSSVARALGELLGVPVRDTDADVVAAAGKEISDIFLDDGEAAFRALEQQAVGAALAEHTGVLALGGGAVLDPRTEVELAGHTVVFLDVTIADAAPRIGLNTARPLLIGNPRAQWTKLMEHRRPIYQRVATHRVPTDGRGVREVAEQVAELLGYPGRPQDQR